MIHNEQELLRLLGEDPVLVRGKKRYPLAVESQPLCSQHCPAGINVKGYLSLIAGKRYQEALELVRDKNPFPGICGRVCTHPCEANCLQGEQGEALNVRGLKRFVADYEVSRDSGGREPYPLRYKERVAVIGSGPAGITAALDLRELGYETEVFEAMPTAGGMLAWGIPEFRLPRKTLARELDIIQELGVTIHTNSRVEEPTGLLERNFDAVVVAAGSWKGIPLRIPGSELEGVVDCLDFLRSVYQGERRKLNGHAVVIGGGDSAFDAARTALRLGADKVTIAYRRTKKEMPATRAEIEEAKEEGVVIRELAVPKAVIGKVGRNGRITGVLLLKAKLGKPDSSGRRRPVPIEGSDFLLDCDCLITAISAKPDLPAGFKKNIELTKKGLIKTKGFATSAKGVFAAGDVVRGPSTIVEVIGDGHLCAGAVHNYLRGEGEGPESESLFDRAPGVVVQEDIPKPGPRQDMGLMEAKERGQCFEEMECGFSEKVALEESSRCRRCGSCAACQLCLPDCDSKQLLVTLDGEEFMVKVPEQLSRTVHQGVDSGWELERGEEIKNLVVSSLTPKVDPTKCIACARCEMACAYRAVRVGLKAGGGAFSQIDHDVCRSCGRCVLPCPTGAISLPYYSRKHIQEELERVIKANHGIALIVSYWDLVADPEELEAVALMTSSGATPALIIQALAAGARGVLLLHRESWDQHYLPVDIDAEDIVEDARDILAVAGVDPARVENASFSMGSVKQKLQDFKTSLETKGLKPYKAQSPQFWSSLPEGMIGRELALLEELASQEGKQASPLLLEGMVLKGARLPDNLDMLEAIDLLSERLGLGLGECKDKADKGEEIIVATPEGHQAVLEYMSGGEGSHGEGKKDNVQILPQLIAAKLDSMEFNEADPITVAILDPCPGEMGVFTEPLEKILEQIPNCWTVKLEEPDCGQTGWKAPNAQARRKAMKVYNAAQKAGARLIVTASASCLTHLLATNRPGAWLHSPVKVVDVYSFILSRLKGGEADE